MNILTIILISMLTNISHALAPHPINFAREEVRVGGETYVVQYKESKLFMSQIDPRNRVQKAIANELEGLGCFSFGLMFGFLILSIILFLSGHYKAGLVSSTGFFSLFFAFWYGFKV